MLMITPEMTSPISARVIFVTGLMVAVLLTAAPPSSEAAITCSVVLKDLRPCFNYLRSGSGMPPSACCAGASSLASAVSTTADRQAACQCLKSAAKSMNPNAQLAQSLASNCGINLSVSVSPNVDCSKVS